MFVPTFSSCVRTFRSVDTHPRSAKVSLRRVHRNSCQCGFFARLATFLALAKFPFTLFPFLDQASTSIGLPSCVFAFADVLKMRLLLK